MAMDTERTMKGQYFSFDAVIASIIFVLALTSLISYWNSTKNTFDLQNSEMAKEAFRIGGLMFTPGFPSDVDCQAQEQLGFAANWNDKRLRKEQVDCAVNAQLSQGSLKKAFSTQFNVSIYIDDGNGVKIIGQDISGLKTRNLLKIRRVASIMSVDARSHEETEQLANIDVYVYQ